MSYLNFNYPTNLDIIVVVLRDPNVHPGFSLYLIDVSPSLPNEVLVYFVIYLQQFTGSGLYEFFDQGGYFV